MSIASIRDSKGANPVKKPKILKADFVLKKAGIFFIGALLTLGSGFSLGISFVIGFLTSLLLSKLWVDSFVSKLINYLMGEL